MLVAFILVKQLGVTVSSDVSEIRMGVHESLTRRPLLSQFP